MNSVANINWSVPAFVAASCMILFVNGQTAMPNVLIINVDDMIHSTSWTDSAPATFTSEDWIPVIDTPFIDRIFEEGFRFKYSYAASPKCSPSRYALLTGRYASKSGEAIRIVNLDPNENPFPTDGTRVDVKHTRLEEDTPATNDYLYNAPKFLSDNGYYTCMVGKWHLLTSRMEKESCNDMTTASGYESCVAEVENVGFDFVDGLYYTNINDDPTADYSHNLEWLTDVSKQCIDTAFNTENKPFFLYYAPTVPHLPYFKTATDNYELTEIPGEDLSSDPDITYMADRDTIWTEVADGTRASYTNTNRRNVAAAMAWVDESLKELYMFLNNTNDLDDTIIIFMNDHGTLAKSTLYERGVRIFTFVRYPGGGRRSTDGSGVTANTLIDDIIVSNIDILPTLIEYADLTLSIPTNYTMDGVSWASKVTESTPRDNTNFNYRILEYEQSRAIVSFDPSDNETNWDTCTMYKYIWRASQYYFEDDTYSTNQADCYQIYRLTDFPTGAREQVNLIGFSGPITEVVEILAALMINHAEDTCPDSDITCNTPLDWAPPSPPPYVCPTLAPTDGPTAAPTVATT